MDKPIKHDTKKETKTVGGSIDVDIYWKFKMAAADRQESMQQALSHAILLYIDCVDTANMGGGEHE